ncbi:MAG: lysophospholipid acyltransferase family protein [Acidimicrobiales bacterium]
MSEAADEREYGKLYPLARMVLTPTFKAMWRFKVSGLDSVPESGGAILCPNHVSVLDSFFLPLILPRRIMFVGKAEYMDSWKTKHLFPALGMIPIDRGGGSAAERALDTAAAVLERGGLFGIYPEGTRSRDGVLHKGHTGPARLALRTGAPLVPVGFRGTREVMPADAKLPRVFLPVEINFGKPIRVDRYRSRGDDRLVLRQLTDEVMYSIRELSGQEYVDSYATKRAEALPTDTARIPSANGHGEHAQDASDAPRRSSAQVLGTGS